MNNAQDSWDVWSPQIIATLNLKQSTKGEWHGACPACGGKDRFWINEHGGEVKTNCRQCTDFKPIKDELRSRGLLPRFETASQSQSGSAPIGGTDDFDDATPYHVRKRIDLIGAEMRGSNVIVPIYNAQREKVGEQRIAPNGDKRFTTGMKKDGAFAVVGKPKDGTIYVAEGWATAVSVHMATGCQVIVGLDAGNLPKAAAAVQTLFPDAEMVVAADNDDKGIEAARATGLPHSAPQGQGDDWSDVWMRGGEEAVRSGLQRRTEAGGPGPSQMKMHRIFTLSDAKPVLAAPYLIKGWLGQSGMSVVYGPSNVGKSFFCLDMAFSVAASADWNGARVRGGAVLYLATEGGNAFRNRVYALKEAKGVTDAPLLIRPSPIDLLRAEVDLPALMALCDEVKANTGDIKMIVVDTLSRAMAGGNENGPEDMTRFIGNLDALRDLTGAHIMIVHHSGKDTAAGARGHSSLRAATDTEIEMEVGESGIRIAKNTKQRDMEMQPPLGFTLKVHTLGEDEDGDPVTTCTILMASDEAVREAKTKTPKGANQVLVMRAFQQLRSDGVGKPNPGGVGWPEPGTRWCIPEDELKRHAIGKLSDKANPHGSYSSAINGLIAGGFVERNDGHLWCLGKEGKAT